MYLFYFREASEPGPREVQRETPTERLLPVDETAPIEKGYFRDRDAIVYELEGTFTEQLQVDGGFLRSRFVLKDDPLGRDIQVLMGTPDGKVYTGYYQDSFDSASTWQFRDSNLIASTVQPGNPVRITVMLSTATSKAQGYKEQAESVLDTIIREYSSNDFNLDLPEGFMLSISRLGIIR